VKTEFALKMGVAALALSLLAGNAWAAAGCARPQEMKALQAAALQQQLMVAALTCHAAADYNRFVTSYRGALLESDRALMNFFLRQDVHKGADGYNAYKTRLANASSLRSLRDPQFCRSAKVAFDVALKRKGSLAELASERPSLIETGYTSCVPAAPETTLMADATPNLPERHLALPDSQASASIVVPKPAPRLDRVLPPISPQRYAGVPAPSGAPKAIQVAEATPSLPALHQALPDSLPSALIIAPASAPRPDRALPSVSPRRDANTREAYERDTDERADFDRYGPAARDDADAGDAAPRNASRYADAVPQPPRAYDRGDDGYGDNTGDNSGNRDGADNGRAANDVQSAYRYAYNAPRAYVPYAYRPGAYWVHSYGPPVRPRLVRGPYGRWYLLPPYGR
jgi:hypothetical protein